MKKKTAKNKKTKIHKKKTTKNKKINILNYI